MVFRFRPKGLKELRVFGCGGKVQGFGICGFQGCSDECHYSCGRTDQHDPYLKQ